MNKGIERLYNIAFTHRNLSLSDVGKLHIAPEDQKVRLTDIKSAFGIDELMYLTTCNRVEFTLVAVSEVDESYLMRFINGLFPMLNSDDVTRLAHNAVMHQGKKAFDHLLSVASSVDSMVVGEREIITQVRGAFESSRDMGLSGDLIRIVIRHTIETAKRVYTETSIATRPVSVVSLAYHNLRDMNVPLDSRIIIIGAGVTNTNMSKFLKKHGFTDFHVFNRTLSKAEQLADDLKGTAYPLTELASFDKGFDLIITCTGADEHIITQEIYENLLQGEDDRKVVIDLAIPQDLNPSIINHYNVTHISVEVLQEISNENLKARSEEIQHVEEILSEASFEFDNIYKQREIEIAMREVPEKVKEIKQSAINEVFKNELSTIDEESREVLEKVLGYMEKKYMSIPMLMAKEILLKNQSK
jgi:glutamyl-tRNA reductase